MFSTYEKDKKPVCALLDSRKPHHLRDLERLKPTHLFWAMLGSGVVNLELLEMEACGNRPWAKKGMNDKQFIEYCKKRRIKAFAVLWEAHGYDKIPIRRENGKITKFMSWRGSNDTIGIPKQLIEKGACRNI